LVVGGESVFAFLTSINASLMPKPITNLNDGQNTTILRENRVFWLNVYENTILDLVVKLMLSPSI
jgi:hypothetical protein